MATKHREDVQLNLYADIFKNDYMHYGYWEDLKSIDPAKITLQEVREAQVRHAEKLCSLMSLPPCRVLDAGCGMGGFSDYLYKKGYEVIALSPEAKHIQYIKNKYPHLDTINSRFEDMDTFKYAKRFDVIVMLESCQYIEPSVGLRVASALLKEEGRLLISDFFPYRKNVNRISQNGHQLDIFLKEIENNKVKLAGQIDITDNILPTLMYAQRVMEDLGIPLFKYFITKFGRKNRFLSFLLKGFIGRLEKKFDCGMELLDPELFKKYKQYCMLEIIK